MLVDPRPRMTLRKVTPAPNAGETTAEVVDQTAREVAGASGSVSDDRREASSDGTNDDIEATTQPSFPEYVDPDPAPATGYSSISVDSWDTDVDRGRILVAGTPLEVSPGTPDREQGSVDAERDRR